MLEARSVALVGASARPGSLGARMIAEVARSPSRPRTYLVNPRYAGHRRRALPAGSRRGARTGRPGPARGARPRARAGTVRRGEEPGPFGRYLRQRRRPTRRHRATVPAGRDRRGGGHGPVRRGVHGLRERRPRPAGHRLRRARPAAGRAGRAGHPLGFGVLGAAADPPRLRLQPGRLLRPGARHHRGGLRPVRARARRDQGARPGPRGDQGRARAARGAGGRAGRGRAGGAAQRGRVTGRPGAGLGPLRRAGRGRRRLGSAGRRLRPAPRPRPGRTGRHP